MVPAPVLVLPLEGELPQLHDEQPLCALSCPHHTKPAGTYRQTRQDRVVQVEEGGQAVTWLWHEQHGRLHVHRQHHALPLHDRLVDARLLTCPPLAQLLRAPMATTTTQSVSQSLPEREGKPVCPRCRGRVLAAYLTLAALARTSSTSGSSRTARSRSISRWLVAWVS